MRSALLVAWVALLGTTRIDLLGGAGPFLLTPFLALSPVLLLIEAWHLADEGWQLRMPPHAGHFALALGALLALLLASTFLSFDLATSGRRYALLFVQVWLTFAIGVMLANRPDSARILVRGAYAGLALSFLFDLGQLGYWLDNSFWPDAVEAFVSLEPGNYMAVIPRFTGLSHDPNHGGLAVVFNLALILVLGRASTLRRITVALGALAVAVTLSRSALLAGGTLAGGLVLWRRGVRLTPGMVGAAGGAVALLTAVYLALPGALDPVAELGDMLSNRFSLEEGSTSEHMVLLRRGWEVGTRNIKHALLGIGYGNAYVTVQDIFPGNEYGNYHSLFVTFFAEAGVVTALLTVWIFAHALLVAGPWWPLIASLAAFNLFQQAHTSPLLWLGLMLAWLGLGLAGGQTDAGEAGPEGGEETGEEAGPGRAEGPRRAEART